MKSQILILLITGFLVDSAVGQQEKSDLDKIKGAWIIESAMMEGRNDEEPKGITFDFADGKLKIISRQKQVNHATFNIDASKKPKEFDIEDPSSGIKIRGVYSLVGDELKMCMVSLPPVKEGEKAVDITRRPTEINGGPGQGLWILKRQKS